MGREMVVGMVVVGSGAGVVGGCCLHVLHLKCIHRQTANDLSFMIR